MTNKYIANITPLIEPMDQGLYSKYHYQCQDVNKNFQTLTLSSRIICTSTWQETRQPQTETNFLSHAMFIE